MTLPQPLTIVMYHYVRPLGLTRFPAIKGLDLSLFREQVEYLRRHYEFVSGPDLLGAIKTGLWDLPRNAVLLTFDDGYVDHFSYVFPILDEHRLPACFFPPASAVVDRSLLDVHRIQFVLASTPDKRLLVAEILASLDQYRAEFNLPTNDQLLSDLAEPSRHDSADVMFIKNMLQVALPPALRARITEDLFAHHVSADERAFAEELYVGVDQLRCMVRHGMYVGSHGDRHVWMSTLDAAAQARDIDRAVEMLRFVGTPTQDWIMCYPYGDSNQSLREVLQQRGCRVGLTTEVNIANGAGDPLLMPRLDTNDLPKIGAAAPCEWTLRVLQ